MNLNSHLNDFIFCSFIIPTIGRSSLVKAVESVINQDCPAAENEIIVVNDSGNELDIHSLPVTDQISVINTNKRERNFARNTGAAIARGQYLWFLDDDDWLLPGALQSFWQLANRNPSAVWLYGGLRIVDENDRCLAEPNPRFEGYCFAQVMGGAWAPLQASMIKSQAFFQVGGFNPRILGTEDEDLCRRLAYEGEFANTASVVACLFRGRDWSTTTNYQRAPDDTKYSRDLILSQPGAFTRLLKSSPNSYWSGRICRIYLSTVDWNLKHRKIATALSRFMFCLAAFIRSGVRVLNPDFWKGFRAHHARGALHFVMQDYEQGKRHNTFPSLKEREL